MDLPNIFKAKQAQQGKFFLAILLANNSVQSCLWQAKQGSLQILQKSKVHSFTDQKEIVIKIDQTLQELGKDSENVNETLFGFEPDWVTTTGILDSKKPLLKKIAKDLSLKAVGFVVVTEALVEYLVNQQPFYSSLILYVGQEYLHVLLVKQGQLVKSQSVGRSASLEADLTEALARMKLTKTHQVTLPATILLTSASLSQQEMQDVQQQLLKDDWTEQFKFLQTPIIEILKQKELINVITLEGGQAVAQAQGLLPAGDLNDSLSNDSLSNDLTDSAQTAKSSHQEKTAQAASFGVPIKKEFLQPAQEDLPVQTSGLAVEQPSPKSTSQTRQQTARVFNWFKGLFRTNSSTNQAKKIIVFGALGGLLTVVLLGIGLLYFKYQAVVNIKLAQQTVAKEVEIKLDPTIEQTDPENLILKASLVDKIVEDSKSKPTTGVKLVGDPAQGTVTLFNKTEREKTFDQGTEINIGDLVFTLDEEVKVASASVEEADDGDSATKVYGQKEVAVTAAKIGADSNIEADTQLQVADFGQDTYLAKANDAFSGGSSREIRVVSQEDQADLKQSLTKDLLNQAKEEFAQESSGEQYFVFTGDYQIEQADFNAQVGEEIETLSLDLSLSVQGLAYQSSDLQPLAQAVLSKETPEGFTLSDQEPEILSSPSQQDEASPSSRLVLQANLSTQARARLENEQVKQLVAGLLKDQAIHSLQEKASVAQVEINFWPVFANWFMQKIPNDLDRIKVNTN